MLAISPEFPGSGTCFPVRNRQLFLLPLVLLGLFLFGPAGTLFAQDKYPELEGEFFSDLTGKVDAATKREIARDMRHSLQDSKIHVVLACINRMGDYPKLPQQIEKFSEAVAERWEIGEKKSKLGILVLFSIDDRKFSVNKTKEMSTRLTDDIKAQLMDLPVKALKQNNVALAMRRAKNVLLETVPSFDSAKGAKNVVGNGKARSGKTRSTTSPVTNRNQTRRQPPTRVIKQEKRSGGAMGGLFCAGFAFLMIFLVVIGIFSSSSRGYGRSGYGGRGYGYGHGPGYGGDGFFSGMLTGGLLGSMFGGSHHGWGGGYHHEEHHHHHYDDGGGYDAGGYDAGGYDAGGYDAGGYDAGGFDYGADTFGGGDFDGGSFGEW